MRLKTELKVSNDLLKKLTTGAQVAMKKALNDSAKDGKNIAKTLILSGEKTGRIYQKYNPTRKHQASAPGESPANDLGKLASSVYWKRGAGLTASFGASAKYAPYLEFGTRNIAPRPFLYPAGLKINKIFKERVRLVMQGKF